MIEILVEPVDFENNKELQNFLCQMLSHSIRVPEGVATTTDHINISLLQMSNSKMNLSLPFELSVIYETVERSNFLRTVELTLNYRTAFELSVPCCLYPFELRRVQLVKEGGGNSADLFKNV